MKKAIPIILAIIGTIAVLCYGKSKKSKKAEYES